jgi:hypothetical protein
MCSGRACGTFGPALRAPTERLRLDAIFRDASSQVIRKVRWCQEADAGPALPARNRKAISSEGNGLA